MLRAMFLVFALSAPVAQAETIGAQELAESLAGSRGGSQGISFPVISDMVMWRVRVAGPKGAGAGDVTVRLNDRAEVDQAMAEAAGSQACKLLGRTFTPGEAVAAPEVWTWRGACL